MKNLQDVPAVLTLYDQYASQLDAKHLANIIYGVFAKGVRGAANVTILKTDVNGSKGC